VVGCCDGRGAGTPHRIRFRFLPTLGALTLLITLLPPPASPAPPQPQSAATRAAVAPRASQNAPARATGQAAPQSPAATLKPGAPPAKTPPLTLRPPAPPSPPPDRLLYGVEANWEGLFRGGNDIRQDMARTQRMLDLMRLIGVTNTRVEVSWAEVEATRGRYDWRRLDRLIPLLKSHGLVITCLVGGAPSWAVDPTSRPERGGLASSRRAGGLLLPSDGMGAEGARFQLPAAASLPDLGRFAAVLGNRYRAGVHRWECWSYPSNEAGDAGRRSSNGGPAPDPAAYARLLRVFSSNIKRADPACLVGIGGLRADEAVGALNRLYAVGAKDAFDAVCLDLAGEDEFTTLAAPDNPLRAVGRLLRAHGDARKRLWVTAWGWATYPQTPAGIVQGEQARRVKEALAAMRSDPDIEMACLQTLDDWRPVRSDPLNLVGTGLLDRDLLAKPALAAFGLAAQHLRVAPERFQFVGPTTVTPAVMQTGATHILIDATDITGRIPALWRGLHLTGSDRRLLAGPQWNDLSKGLAANNAPLLRLNPLRPGLVSLLADGTPVVAWEDADAMVQAAARHGANIIMTLTAPPGLTDDAWRALVTAVVRRYKTTAGEGVVRWEMEADHSDVAGRYPTFASAVRAVLPTVQIGVDLREEDPLPAARLLLAALLRSHSPLDHVGWLITPATPPVEIALAVRRLRALLGARSDLRRAFLLPDLQTSNADLTAPSPARWASLTDRLLDFAPPDDANGLFGALAAYSALHSEVTGAQSEAPTATWQTLTLINGLIGARLQAVEDDSGVRCLATRTNAGVNILLWAEPAPTAFTERPTDRLALVQLRHLPLNASGGWRIARRTVAPAQQWGTRADASGGQSASALTLASLPTEEADTAAGNNLELPVMVTPGAVTLITLRPHRPPLLKIDAGVSNPVVYGGAAQDVLIQLHNPGTKPMHAELLLVGSHPGLVPTDVARLDLGALPPGSAKRLRYPLRAPLVGRDGEMSVNVHVRIAPPGKSLAAGEECRAAVTWKTLASLTAELVAERVDLGRPGDKGLVDLRLTNRTRAPLTATVDGGQGPASILLSAVRKPMPMATIVPATVVIPTTDPGIYPALIQIGSQGVPLLTLAARVGVPVISHHVAAPPKLDGDPAEWPGAPPISLGREDQWRGRTWGGPEDLSATVDTRWDEQNLYILCTVTQAQFTPPGAAEEWERRDTVTLGFQSAAYGAADNRGTEQEYRLALVGGKQSTIMRVGVANVTPTGARVAIRRSGNHTYYEAAIPWRELAAQAQPNTAVWFAVTVTHGDGQASGAMVWGEGLGADGRPHIYPPLRLEP
jgi:hypothetical protein